MMYPCCPPSIQESPYSRMPNSTLGDELVNGSHCSLSVFSYACFPKHICAGGLYEASGTMCYRLCQEQNSAAGDAKEAKYDFCHQISWEFIKFSINSQ